MRAKVGEPKRRQLEPDRWLAAFAGRPSAGRVTSREGDRPCSQCARLSNGRGAFTLEHLSLCREPLQPLSEETKPFCRPSTLAA